MSRDVHPQWYWSKKNSDERNGPVGRERLEGLAAEGNLEREDLVWREGFDDWKKAGSVEELEELFASPPPLPDDPSDGKVEQPPTLPQSEPDDQRIYDAKADVEGNIKISKYIRTSASRKTVKNEIGKELSNICKEVSKSINGFEISKVAQTFGATNRSANGTVIISRREKGYLVRAGIKYTTSWEFWVLIVFLLYTFIGWFLPIGFYLYHKKVVKREIEQAFGEVEVLVAS